MSCTPPPCAANGKRDYGLGQLKRGMHDTALMVLAASFKMLSD